tara:strand:+ start:112 stop:717 length:606 start_codon:yes stop_codon:yes gene_type:complete
MKNIEKLVDKTVNGSGDSDRHIMTLFSIALASKSKVMIELGVRGGDTTIPLLEAAKINGGMLYSVDINDVDFEVSDDLKPHWKFIKSDAIKFLEEWDPTKVVDFFYVDDWHSYEHVKRELEIIDTLVSPSSVVLLHDLMYGGTCPFYHVDLTNDGGAQWTKGGPYRAVAELNPQFWEFSTLPWNNGLTLLRKKYSSKFSNK